MHTIKVDLSDSVFEKVMQFLQKLPQDAVFVQETKQLCKDRKAQGSNDLVDFFQSSPLKDIEITRENEIFSQRTKF